jgi:alcohol dehydrogenase
MNPTAVRHEARSIALDAWQVVLRPSRVLDGAGRLAELGSLTAELGGRRALLVTDPGIHAAGHVALALDSLAAASVATTVFDAVVENPTSDHVEAAAARGRAARVDLVIGLGGGSAMDCAKGANFLLTNGGRMEDYRGWNRAARPMLASIGVPCTAGTGSEAQSYALIADATTHAKMACGDEKARFRAVILDPDVVRTAPRAVAAIAGYDAIAHAVESLVSRDASPLSRMLSREAWRLLERNYEIVVGASAAKRSREGEAGAGGPDAWGEMLLGSHLAGAAIEASMLGAAHACANPLTARFDVTHGVAVGLMLPAVVRANARDSAVATVYGELLGVSCEDAGESLARRLESLRDAGGLPSRLSRVGVDAGSLPSLAADAVDQWTLQHNPRRLGEAELAALYREVL